jgi:YidC/Oxa1 family membrane protein insertase
MFLFALGDIVKVPFGWILAQLNNLTNNYGAAMILFAVLVQLVLFPMNAKSKKSMMKMSRLQPRVQELQKKYADDPQRQNQAIQKLYQDEGASMGGGCIWSLIPMLILFPLFRVIQQPLVYIMGESVENAQLIIDTIRGIDASLFGTNSFYDQVFAAAAIWDNPTIQAALAAAVPGIKEATLEGLNSTFLGINLGIVPDWKFWAWDVWNWATIGAFLIPCLSAGSQLLQMWISQKTNDSVVTNEKGMQDQETAKNSQAAQSTKTMMWMMPLMSLWIGFSYPASMSLYWFIGGVVRMTIDPIMTQHYRKIYDAEDAERMKKYLAEQAIEEEKERIRAEKRAANPDGITQNTSKKKLLKQQQAEEAAAKAAAAKEYAAKKGIPEEEAKENIAMSGIADRPYCKGRNYDPNRYNSTEE